MKKSPKNIPHSSGVYFFKKGGEIIYIGKAKNLKERIASYFSKQNIDVRKIDMTNEATTVTWQETESDAETLIREAELIKKYQPKYNIVMRDDKQYFYVGFTNDTFPRIFLTHQPKNGGFENWKLLVRRSLGEGGKIKNLHYIGPFTDGASLKQTLNMLRRAFPYCICKGTHKRKCQHALIGKCLGICCIDVPGTSKMREKNQYKKNIRIIKKVLTGKGKTIIKSLEKEMKTLSQKQRYEKAALRRDQLYALGNIFSHHHIIKREEEQYAHKGLRYLADILHLSRSPKRIEAYDISNIQGKHATGAMAAFTDGKPDKNEYRKFNIRLPALTNDTAMMKEIIIRRGMHNEWKNPDVIVIDGGKPQLHAALSSYKLHASRSKIIALAKREEELYLPNGTIIQLKKGPPALLHLLQYIRNEAHRFAIQHHRKRRSALLKTSHQ